GQEEERRSNTEVLHDSRHSKELEPRTHKIDPEEKSGIELADCFRTLHVIRDRLPQNKLAGGVHEVREQYQKCNQQQIPMFQHELETAGGTNGLDCHFRAARIVVQIGRASCREQCRSGWWLYHEQ